MVVGTMIKAENRLFPNTAKVTKQGINIIKDYFHHPKQHLGNGFSQIK
jgi:hypothetical protein